MHHFFRCYISTNDIMLGFPITTSDSPCVGEHWSLIKMSCPLSIWENYTNWSIYTGLTNIITSIDIRHRRSTHNWWSKRLLSLCIIDTCLKMYLTLFRVFQMSIIRHRKINLKVPKFSTTDFESRWLIDRH